MSWWLIYWITRLDSIRDALEGIMVLGILLSVVGIIIITFMKCFEATGDYARDDKIDNSFFAVLDGINKWVRRIIPITLIFIILTVLTPNLKEAAAIYLIPKMVNNEVVQEIPGDAVKLLQLKLNEWIDDLNPVRESPKD